MPPIAPTPSGLTSHVFNALTEELTSLEHTVSELETRLGDVLLPPNTSTPTETPQLPPASPLAVGLLDLALRLQRTRGHLQDIYNRIDV